MIFFNPAGAPELACNECGCRWLDRLEEPNTCYDCGEEVTAEDQAEYAAALEAYYQKTGDRP